MTTNVGGPNRSAGYSSLVTARTDSVRPHSSQRSVHGISSTVSSLCNAGHTVHLGLRDSDSFSVVVFHATTTGRDERGHPFGKRAWMVVALIQLMHDVSCAYECPAHDNFAIMQAMQSISAPRTRSLSSQQPRNLRDAPHSARAVYQPAWWSSLAHWPGMDFHVCV